MSVDVFSLHAIIKKNSGWTEDSKIFFNWERTIGVHFSLSLPKTVFVCAQQWKQKVIFVEKNMRLIKCFTVKITPRIFPTKHFSTVVYKTNKPSFIFRVELHPETHIFKEHPIHLTFSYLKYFGCPNDDLNWTTN